MGTVRAELNDDGLIILEGDPGEKVVPGARTVDGTTSLPLSWAAANMIRGVFEDDLEIGPELQKWAEQERERRVDIAMRSREATDGPDFNITEFIEREDDGLETQAVDVESAWWWGIWRGMPEYLNRNLDAWKTIKVHLRGPSDMEEFARRMQQTVTTQTRFIWFPEGTETRFDEWRWVDEDTPTEEYPDRARKPVLTNTRTKKASSIEATPRKRGSTAPRLKKLGPNPKLKGLK